MALNLHVPQSHDEFRPRICVVGVGGAGGNAINNMISSGLEGVEFLVCNTDSQDLSQSLCDNRLQLGPTVTKGLGAGMQPQIGAEAATESMEEILHRLDGANMVFITAGMGGGTGTGAAPVIAKGLRERNVLTVGVVTKPFQFEGMRRAQFADEGINNLADSVDTLIVIPNQNLFRIANEKTTFADAFKMADNVLLDGVRGVTDLIVKPGIVNLDFADVRTLMTVMGKAMMGTGEAEGDSRALDAAERAIANPLLDDLSLDGAKGVLINVTGGSDITLYEVDAVANHVREKVDPGANIIFGSAIDESLTGILRVSVVATGIDAENMPGNGPQGQPPRGPSGGPAGPGGGGGGIPSPGAAQTSMPTAPANTPPMSPFGRNPFAFRSGNNEGPTSQHAQGVSAAQATAPVESTAAYAQLYAQQPAPAQAPLVSPNYSVVPPARQETAQYIPVEAPNASEPAPAELADQSTDLFGNPAPTLDQQDQSAAAQPRGGLFSRFGAQRAETIPSGGNAPAGAPEASFGIGAAVAAANASTQPFQAAPQSFTDAPEPQQHIEDLDSAPGFHSGEAHAPAEQGDNRARVVDLDSNSAPGLDAFDASYKAMPAFLRHQNN